MDEDLKPVIILVIVSVISTIFIFGVIFITCAVYNEHQCLSAAKHLGTTGAYFNGTCAIKGYNITS